jgi:hypothetical protein
MGSRANLVLVTSYEYQLYYCHWCGQTIPGEVFWGADVAIPYVLQQRRVETDENGWLNDVWAEGGVLIDVARKVVLVWGGEDIYIDIPLQRLYLDLMRETWVGWEVRWAREEIFEQAAYVGVDRALVTSSLPISPHMLPDAVKDASTWIINTPLSVGSIDFGDTMLFYPTDMRAHEILLSGDSILSDARAKGLELLDFQDRDIQPHAGFHIDIPQKRIHHWDARYRAGFVGLRAAWAGWDVTWLQDRFEVHLELARGRLRFPSYTADELLKRLEGALYWENHILPDRETWLKKIAKDIWGDTETVTINPYALRDDPLVLSTAEKRRIFDQAVARWRARSAQP